MGVRTIDRTGRIKTALPIVQGVGGVASGFYKIGTAAEAVGSWYSFHKDTGVPGAWAPGTPGLNGRNTDGTTTTDNGCIRIRNASSGANYVTGVSATQSVAGSLWLFDVLWVNSGIVVTTTTAQAITSPTWPARDLDGGTNGEGCWVGLLVTTATTNAAAIANTTLSYTNSAGTAGRTATMASFPATAVIGTVVWFELAAGDSGPQSIQSITLGTSRVAGALSLIIARPIAEIGNPVVNVAGLAPIDVAGGTRIYDGTCLLPFRIASATTATSIAGTVQVTER